MADINYPIANNDEFTQHKLDYIEQADVKIKNEVSNKINEWDTNHSAYWSDVMDETEWLRFSFTPTGENHNARLYKEITANSGDNIYISVLAKSDHYNPVKSRVFASLNRDSAGNYPHETTDLYDFSKIGEIQKLSGIGVADTSNYILLSSRIERDATGSYTQFAKPIVINLTGIFGVGNEPTKSEMNILISLVPNNWWDGEITLTQKQLLNWQLHLIRQNRNAIIELGGTII